MTVIRDIIKKNLVPPGEFIYGLAELQGLLSEKFAGFHYGISIGRKLDDRIVDKLGKGPTIEYFNHYKKVNKELADLSERIHLDLEKTGIESMTVPPTISPGNKGYEEYLETLVYDISHKMVATRAGLGWIGKTDLLVSNEFGPRLRLVSILLKEKPELIADPIEKSRCGKCNICVVKCPANAANGKLWDKNTYRDEFFDAHKCRDKCAELAKQKLNVEERICGLCVYVCPFGHTRKLKE